MNERAREKEGQREGERCERATRTATAKINVPFERRYLENGTSYRHEVKTVLKRRIFCLKRAKKMYDFAAGKCFIFSTKVSATLIRFWSQVLLIVKYIDEFD